MKLLMINPNSDHETNRRIEEKMTKSFGGQIDFDCVCIEDAPKLVATKEGEAASIPAMTKLIREKETEYDGFVIACHADPNLDIMREVTKKPVVGIAEASYLIAQTKGNSFAVICPGKGSISRKYAQTRKYYCDALLKKVIVANGDTEADMLDAARRAAAEDVDVIVLGCANYTLDDLALEREVGIPVIDGVACAALIAAGMASYQKYKEA